MDDHPAHSAASDGTAQALLAYRPPLDWDWLMRFLSRRTIAGVETVAGDTYRRTVAMQLDGAVHQGWIAVSPSSDAAALRITCSASLVPVLPQVQARLGRLFDVDCNPAEVVAALGPWAAVRPGLRVPGAWDGFEVAVRAVLGQQVTVRAAHTVAGRVARRFGTPIVTPFDGLDVVFPAAARMVDASVDDIASLGINAARARSIRALAGALADGSLRLSPGEPVAATVARLLDIPGVGDWTAQYLAMRGLGAADAFPAADYGVMKALGVTTARQALARAEGWRPWRAYAVIHLWASLDTLATAPPPTAA